jgi:glc operon protein GlcG
VRKLFPMLVLAGTAASAQPASHQLDAAAAQAIVAGCVNHATPRHQSQAIVVVDTGGHLIAALRMDGNGYGSVDFATAKAEAAAAWGFPSAAMAEGARMTPGFAAAPHVVTVPGGIPVFSADGRQRLGAVGVSGESPAHDEACAEAGVTAAGFRFAPMGH